MAALEQQGAWDAWPQVPIVEWRPWRIPIRKDVLSEKKKVGQAGTIFWVPTDYNSDEWH